MTGSTITHVTPLVQVNGYFKDLSSNKVVTSFYFTMLVRPNGEAGAQDDLTVLVGTGTDYPRLYSFQDFLDFCDGAGWEASFYQ